MANKPWSKKRPKDKIEDPKPPKKSGVKKGQTSGGNTPGLRKPRKKPVVVYSPKEINLEELTFNTFMSYYKTGLYNFNDVCLRLGIDSSTMKELINKDSEKLSIFNDLLNDPKFVNLKANLVQTAIESLDKQIRGSEQIIEQFYRVNGGQKTLVSEKVKNSGASFPAIKEVLSKFTDAFADKLTPESFSNMLMLLNKFIVENYDDIDFVEKLMFYETEFIKQMYNKI